MNDHDHDMNECPDCSEYLETLERVVNVFNDFTNQIISLEEDSMPEDEVLYTMFRSLVARMIATGAPLKGLQYSLQNAHDHQMAYEQEKAKGKQRH